MRLCPNEVRPIHRSITCCGRELISRVTVFRQRVQKVGADSSIQGHRQTRGVS